MLIYRKTVDHSLLKEGFSIQVSEQENLLDSLDLYVPRGVKIPLTIILDGKEYQAALTNILFDEMEYPDHCDLLQVRYRANGDLANHLQRNFHYTRDLLQFLRSQNRSTRKIPSDQREYLNVYSTSEPTVLSFECIVNGKAFERLR